MLCVRMTNALCYRSASSLIIVLMNALPRLKKEMKKKRRISEDTYPSRKKQPINPHSHNQAMARRQ